MDFEKISMIVAITNNAEMVELIKLKKYAHKAKPAPI
jgi:hypothetical protein